MIDENGRRIDIEMGRDFTRWSKFSHQKSDYFFVRLTLLIFRSLGLAPLSIVKAHPIDDKTKDSVTIGGSMKFVDSRIYSIYNVSLMIFLFGMSYMSVGRIYDNDYPWKSNLTTTIEVGQAIFSVTIVIGIWSLFSIKQSTMTRLLNRLTSIDRTISRLVDPRKNVATCQLYLSLIFIANSIVWTLVIVSERRAYETAFLDWFNDIWPGMIVSWFVVEYSVMVKIIETRFRRLNRAINDITIRSLWIGTFRSSIHGSMTINDYCQFPQIIEFRRAHTALYEVTNDVSSFYSLPILFAITLNCCSIVYNSYYAVMPFVLEVDTAPLYIVVNSISWLMGLMLPITVLAAGVNRITNEMRKTSDVIHKVLAKSNIHREDKSELKEFSLELLQRKVYFTAYGLFPLDCSLVHSIFSMVVTYLIILFQFQMSGRKNDSR